MWTNRFLLSAFSVLVFSLTTFSQCPNDNTFSLDATPPCPGTQTISNVSGGSSYTVNVVAGNDYTFSTCGNTAFDTQITIYNGPTVIGYNDDACGLQSEVTWTATFTGTVTVLVDQFNCQNTGTGAELVVQCSLPVQQGNGCNTDVTICTPGVAGPFGFSTPGNPVSSCLDWIGLTYSYIILYITQSGPLNMVINGDATTGFLDVAIFDVTGSTDPCAAIENPANEISCNYADFANGCNEIGSYFPCTSEVPAPNVIAGDVLFIVVENWSNASTNFTLELAPPPAAQTGPPDPTITPVGPFCDTDAPVQLIAVNNGGTWTGTGTTTDGIFSPATAGVGTYVIDYAIGSGPCLAASQTTIDVINCSNPCFFDYISSNTGACETGSVFTVDGDFSFQNNPGGNITVEITNASGTTTQTINGPFTNGQLYNYSISGNTADGSPAVITIYFNNDPSCVITQNITSPAGCDCNAEIGTFTVTTDGSVSGNDVTLCFGDLLDITTNNDWVAPDEATNPPGPVYDPGVSWLIYSCPPSVALVPDPVQTIPNDPCILGVISDFDLNEVNDQFWINAYPPGTFTDNTVYFVPITMYSIQDNTYSYVNTTMPCYELGAPYAVQYLPEIIATPTEDCTAGTVSVVVSGGLPAIDGSNFTGQNLTPGTASFQTGTVGNGGTIVVQGLQDGDAYSFDIVDGNGCPVTISGTFVGLEDPSFSYAQSAYCQSAANPTPTVTGDTGGTFTASPGGLVINAGTGQINLAASTPGTYTVTYTTPDAVCFDQADFIITINPLPVVDGNDPVVCEGQQVTLNGTGADTYTWSGGVANGVAFTPGLGVTNYTVTGTITATGCSNTGTSVVTVNALDNPSFTTTNYCFNTASPAATVTGTTGGTFAYNPNPGDGSTVNPTTGSITGGVEGATYTIEYTTAGVCPQSSTQTVTVYALPIVVVQDESVCTGGTVTLTATGANTYTWTPGTYLSGTTGASVDFTAGLNTTYTIEGTDANGCQNSDQASVTVLANAPINAGTDQTICVGESADLLASGGVTYNWLAPIGAPGAAQTVSPAVTTTYTVNGVDAQGCTGSDQVTINVNPVPTATIAGTVAVCQNAGDQTVTFTGANGTAPYTFTYNLNGGAQQTIVSVGNTATITVSSATVGVFSYDLVSVADANGCDQLQTGTATVTINALPNVGAGTDQEVCENTAVTLTGSGAVNYTWDNGVVNNTAFTPAVGVVTYTVTGTDANGCQNTDQVDVTVNGLPNVDAGTDQTVCDGDQVTLSGAGATSYVWDNSVTNGVAFTPGLGTTVYTVIGTDANNCQNTDQVSVTVNPNPTPLIDGATEYCTGTFSTLSTTQAYTTYVWSTGDNTSTTDVTDADNPITVTVTNGFGCIGTSPQFTVSENNVITYNQTITICQGETALIHGNNESIAGVYSQTFLLGTGCDSIANITLVVNPLPPVNAGLDQSVCDGVQTTLSASGAVNYVWDNGVTNGVPFTQAVGVVTYTVTGTDANGCMNTDQVDITVNALPNVDAGTSQTVCDGVQVTLNGSGATSYTWNNGVTDGIAFTQAVGQVTYTVTGTDANNCQNTDQVNVTVNALPNVGAGLDQVVCDGVQVTLNGSGATSYTWDNGVNNGVAFTQAVGTVTYTVTGTDANNCQNADQVDVTVNALPTVVAGADQTICSGDQVILSGSGASTYVWNNGVTNGVGFAPGVGTTTYTVTGTDVNGCVNTDQVDVTVNPLPTATIAGTSQVCVGGGDQTITFTGANGTAPYTFTYTLNGGAPQTITSTGNTATINVSSGTVGTFSYNVVSVQDASATGCSQAQTGTATVTVNPLPNVFAGNDFISCEGEQLVLTGSGATSYTWDNGVTNGVGFVPAGTNVYTVTGTDANGCQNTDQVTVTVDPLPLVSFTADVTSGCAPLTVTFTNTTPGTLNNCIWSFGNGTSATGCGSITTTFTQGGLYDVTLTTTNNNGCTNSATYTDYIYVEPIPVASFTPSSSIVSIFNSTVNFNNTSTNAIEYTWDFGDESPESTEENPTHTYPDEEPGNYVVTLIATSALGCADTVTRVIIVQDELIFYVPNTFTPDGDDYNEYFKGVFTSGYDPYDFNLYIFNRWGELIWESHDANVGWDGTYGEDRNKLVQDGTYTWKIDFKTTMSDERIEVVGHVNVIR